MKAILLDESGDSSVSLRKRRSKTRYFLIVALEVSFSCYAKLSKELKRVIERALSGTPCSETIEELLESGEELKYNSFTSELAKCLGGTSEKLNDRIDGVLAELFEELRSLPCCSDMKGLVYYVDKAIIGKKLGGLPSTFADVKDVLAKAMKPYVFDRLRRDLCERLREEVIVLFDEKFFYWRDPKKERPRDYFNCEKVVDALEVKSHHSVPLAVVDLLAGAYKNSLLHGNEFLRSRLSFVEAFDVTEEFLRSFCEALEPFCEPFCYKWRWQPPGREVFVLTGSRPGASLRSLNTTAYLNK